MRITLLQHSLGVIIDVRCPITAFLRAENYPQLLSLRNNYSFLNPKTVIKGLRIKLP